MKTINIPFPQIEGVELKNATVDLENKVVVAEYGQAEPKFKRGDIVYWTGNHPLVGFVMDENRHDGRDNYVITNLIDTRYDSCHISHIRIATPEQQRALLNALAKQGKRWNAETLEIEDLLLVPESVRIYKYKEMVCSAYDKGDGLHIGFNDNKQLLSVSDGVYHVQPNDAGIFEKVQCYLQPCKIEDLKEGDTAFGLSTNHESVDYVDDLESYCKITNGEERYVYVRGDSGTHSHGDIGNYQLYKLIPLNDN